MVTRILQISDTHLFADRAGALLGVATYETLQRLMECVEADDFKPDMVILTGDLSQDYSEMSYQHLIALLKPIACPIYWIPGNHDNLPVMSHNFAPHFKSEKVVHTDSQWQIILLNSLQAGHVPGYLDDTQLELLRQATREPHHRFGLIFIHHPPYLVGSAWLDRLGLSNKEDFFNVLSGYTRLQAIVTGHVHQLFDEIQPTGVRYLSTPATCIQFLPRSAQFALDKTAMPGYRCIELSPTGELHTWMRYLENYTLTYDPAARGY